MNMYIYMYTYMLTDASDCERLCGKFSGAN